MVVTFTTRFFKKVSALDKLRVFRREQQTFFITINFVTQKFTLVKLYLVNLYLSHCNCFRLIHYNYLI